LIAFSTFILAACQATSTPLPTPVPQNIGVTPLYLDWTSNSLAAFRDEHEGTDFSLDIYALDAGVEAVQNGEIELLIAATDPEEASFAVPLVQDGIVIIHNPDLDIPELSLAELRRIFAGGEQNWQTFGGDDLPIYPVIPLPGDDLRLIFKQRVMGTFQFSTLARLQASPEQVVNLVEEESGAIGIVPFSQVESGVSVFRIDGKTPSLRSIENGSYPLTYWIVAIGEDEPAGALRDWVAWVQAQNN
jgi:phosphate transport system substrate-binding protein